MKKLIAFILSVCLLCVPLTAFAASNNENETETATEESIITKYLDSKWNVKTSDIHPELRLVGNVIRTVLPNFTENFFRLANFFLDNFGEGMNFAKEVNYEEKYITREDGTELRICVYTPKEKQENVPGLLWIHGGGYAIGIPEQDYSFIESFVSFYVFCSGYQNKN